MLALVIDHFSLHALSSAVAEDSWFKNFDLPGEPCSLRRIEIDGIVYILSPRSDESSRLLVINTSTGGVFNSDNNQEIFERLCHVALSRFENSVAVPAKWCPFNDGARLSIYAVSRAKGDGERIYFNRSPLGTDHVYAYALTEKPMDFRLVEENSELVRAAFSNFVDALLKEPERPAQTPAGPGITLTEQFAPYLGQGAGLTEWVKSKLTREQEAFLAKGYSGPVRLRGSAGTGKTVAMAVKFLKDAYEFEKKAEPKRLAFITHSWATVRSVQELLMSLDEEYLWGRWKHVQVKLCSLYDLANELLRYEFDDIRPLHTDGLEGRKMQGELIGSILAGYLSSTKFLLHEKLECSSEFISKITDQRDSAKRSIINELMVEFGSVLDAERVKKGTARAEEYLSAPREAWQMNLPLRADREVILNMYARYCDTLKEIHVLSLDQMISDLNRHFSSHAWERIRRKEGFDAVFVDELHLFSRHERMALHELFRDSGAGRLPLFMAYDLKQSPDDTFAGLARGETAGNFFKSVGVGQSDDVELTRVFRYTPEISAFLAQIDSRFPAMNLPGEWTEFVGKSEVVSGPLPEVWEQRKNLEIVKQVFDAAEKDARRIGGRRVAVLCYNDDLFDKYVASGIQDGKRLNICSRDQIPELRYAGKRFVLSQPRYVAGLQFDTVYLLNVDKAELTEEASTGQRRRFISNIYLGASRAERKLVIATSEERDGLSDVLSPGLKTGALRKPSTS